ncbi:zinc-binding metallopeptidase [Ancylomarina sp. YFZ004]
MKKILFLFFSISILFTSCTKEDDLGKSLIDTSIPELNDVDEWIRENYTYPFNVEVKYRWDNSEVDNSKILTPPAKADVIPFLDNMKKIWIDPYVNAGGIDFMKRFIPKQMVLIGSHNYNDNGSIVLGQAEGGRKISLFDLNYISFDLSGLESWEKSKAMEPILRVFSTMHHEFGHILHQTVAYPIEYKKICTEYTSNWMNFNNIEAKRLGFITAYSMLNPDEDFVEMLSKFLMSGNEGWNKIIDDIYIYDENWNKDIPAADKAKAKIRQKEKIVADYMQQVWNINIYDLQDEIEVILAEIKGE